VAKIIFTYILGYKVDVGHMEAVNLISSPKYSEKQIVRMPFATDYPQLHSIYPKTVIPIHYLTRHRTDTCKLVYLRGTWR